MCGVLTDYTLSSEWRHMKSQVIQKPVVVILGNAGNIGYLAAKAFACQGTVVAMLHEAAMSAYLVPEPATASRSLLGLAGLAMRRRRRQEA